MALIKCSECGKEISDKAKMCNNCGAPIEVKKFKNKHGYMRSILILIFCFTVFVVGMNIYEKYFNYQKVPYCENGYELKNDKCIKEVDRTMEFIGYECPKNYEANEIGTCYLNSIEPIVTRVCNEGDTLKPTGFIDEKTGEEVTNCYGKVRGYGYYDVYDGFYNSKNEYSCPDGYTYKIEGKCVKNELSDLQYYVSGTPICPTGYVLSSEQYNVPSIDGSTVCRNGACHYGNGSSNKNNYTSDKLIGERSVCIKRDIKEPKYKKVHN